MIRVIALLLLFAGFIGVPASGQSESALENVLVTGAHSPQAALSASVTVLDAQQIKILNKRSLSDVLKTIPGLLVEQQGGPGGLSSVSIRGAESNFTLVVLDGIAINDPTNSRGGGFDFANINPALVDRIEVVRGTQSAIYGSDALGGVINIVMRDASEGHQQTVFAELGEQDYSNIALSAAGSSGPFEYALDVASRDDGKAVVGSTRETDSANGRLVWQLTDAQRLNVSYRYLDGERTSYPEQSGGSQFALIDDLDNSEYKDEVFSLAWSARLSQLWASNITASRFSHEELYTSPGIVPFSEVPPNAADTEFDRDKITWVNTINFSEQLMLDMGADYRSEEGESVGYLLFSGFEVPTDFKLDRDTVGYFTSISAKPLADLLLQASARYDDPSGFDGETSLGVGISYRLRRGFTVAANWGEAFKLPSFFALGHGLVGNPKLSPELATSWDLGVRWSSDGEALSLEATYFSNDYRDLIDFDDQTFRNVNRKQVQTNGGELQGIWQVSPGLSLQGQVTYVDLDVVDENSVLTGRPRWSGSAMAHWRLHSNWDTSLNYQYTGEQWAASRYTGELVTERLNSAGRLDWVLRWQPTIDWQLILSADNLMDEHFETAVGFPAPGRSLRIGMRYSRH